MRIKKKFTDSSGEGTIDLKPFLNIIMALIPVLLMSAEFAKIAIIDIKLPEGRGSQTKAAVAEPQATDDENKLLLTAIITDSVVTLGAKGGFLPSLYYREFHHYIAKTEDRSDFTIEYVPGKKATNPKTGREMTVYERDEIYLYVCDENRNIVRGLYSKFGEMVTNSSGDLLTSVNVGDTVFALTNPRRMIVVRDPGEFELRNVSAYDELKNRLMKVKERFLDAEDKEAIIIAAENEVLYDKIVQIMDVAKVAEFPNISIAKLRA